MMYHNTSNVEIGVIHHARYGFEQIIGCSSLEESKRVASELYTDLDGYIDEIECAPVENLDGDIVSCADWLKDEKNSRKK